MDENQSKPKKTKKISIKVTPEDYVTLKKFVKSERMTMSRYIYSRVIEKIKTGRSSY